MPSDNKTAPTDADPKEFIEAVENKTRREDALQMLDVMRDITGEPPVMWGPSIIGFGQYHYKYDSGREGDFLNVGFSPRKANLVLYVLGSINDDDPLLEKIGPFKRGSACLYVTRLERMNMPALRKLIKKSYDRTQKRWA